MLRVVLIGIGLLGLAACETGREMACECVGADVSTGAHPADADYGSCVNSSYTCWVLPNEPLDECSEAHESDEQEAVCCTGDDCSCSCVDQGPTTAG
jgi:hypothetical protein